MGTSRHSSRSGPDPRRPRLAWPFTILTDRDTVRLVAGEDFRYTLTGPGLEHWLPGLLADCDGRHTLEHLLGRLDPAHAGPARELLGRLAGERVLIEGTAADVHPAAPHRLAVEGGGALRRSLEMSPPPADGDASAALTVLCQDRLDYDEAYRFNHRQVAGPSPWLWATTGPLGRGYVSPVFLPGAGPCLACLLRHFQRLSPAPELYDHLIAHARAGGPIAPVPFPAEGVEILVQLVRWKAALLGRPEPPAALYRLHVLEADTLEVSAHRVLPDPECPDCSGAD